MTMVSNGHGRATMTPSLDMHLRAVKKPIEDDLIDFGERFFERYPAAAFLFDEGAERRQRLTHGMIP